MLYGEALFGLMGKGEQERKGYTNIGSLVYTPKPSNDGSATKVVPASLRSSRPFRRHGEEDEPPQWLKQLELLKGLPGEGHNSDGDEFLCKAEQSNERGEVKDPDFCALQSSSEEMGMPAEHEHIEVDQCFQGKQEDGDEPEMQQPWKEMANMKMSMKERENMEVSRKEIENMEMSRRQYFAALIVAKKKPGEEPLALAAGLRLKLQSILAIHSFSSFDS
ncbi:hypothetical protein SUGI_0907950 [Cryptomeria japonica]|uniref:uncharacterized protein LOC131040950 n=1 Tax=Cryptomeria japonica TaxID=3369 RepID=UPI002414CAE9|nr:uncharacterized protein LOC131040950 [Cryptomeria japonica]GLJ43619.1 hypothetical protein SUGI_0907950 [Cryptomeria japonica]